MKQILREVAIYQILAVLLAFLAHPDARFLPSLPGYLIITNCIAWSIRTIFRLASLQLDFLSWPRIWQIVFIPPAVAAGCATGVLLSALIFQLLTKQDVLGGAMIMAVFKVALPSALIVTILILAYQSVSERLQSHALEQERLKSLQARAELAALQSKLNPHFLFNTLNSMLNQVHTEPAKVEEMILGLSDIYRKVLQLPESDRIALADEFELARQYLAIEQVRLGERLTFTIDLPEELKDSQVPPLLIQPLVENAVLHGIAPKPGGGTLHLSAAHGDGVLRIVVEDDGVGFTQDDATDSDAAKSDGESAARAGRSMYGSNGGGAVTGGFGLTSARERLRILHGDQGVLKVESPHGRGTRVTLELPYDEVPIA